MKMTRRDFLNVSTAAAVVCSATLLPVEKAAAAQQTLAAQNLLEQAYLYAFPLVIMDATRTASTNTRTATSNKAPINQFIHAEKLADATTRVVVTPNVDTIYTQAFLDVGAEPMIYGVPQTDRFFNVQVLDAWTNTAAVLETPLGNLTVGGQELQIGELSTQSGQVQLSGKIEYLQYAENQQSGGSLLARLFR